MNGMKGRGMTENCRRKDIPHPGVRCCITPEGLLIWGPGYNL
jgi:hypothetical protein